MEFGAHAGKRFVWALPSVCESVCAFQCQTSKCDDNNIVRIYLLSGLLGLTTKLFLFLFHSPVWHWRAYTKGKACTGCLPIAKGT